MHSSISESNKKIKSSQITKFREGARKHQKENLTRQQVRYLTNKMK
jgi:hypothetical protein